MCYFFLGGTLCKIYLIIKYVFFIWISAPLLKVWYGRCNCYGNFGSADSISFYFIVYTGRYMYIYVYQVHTSSDNFTI